MISNIFHSAPPLSYKSQFPPSITVEGFSSYIDYTAALAFAAANDDLTVKDIGIESDSEGQCIGVQKGNEDFVAYLNEKIAEMQEQGLIDQYVAEAQTLAGIE